MKSIWLPLAALLLGLLLPAVSKSQIDTSIRGKVTTSTGQPLQDVTVYGSKTCCPVKRKAATSATDGTFELQHAGAVLHLFKNGYTPRSIVLLHSSSMVDIVLGPSEHSLTVPVCEKLGSNMRRIGWGKSGLQFDVPKDGTEIVGGKPDVDYVRYGIRRKGAKAYLQLWFGPYAMNLDPDDDVFINSTFFEQRSAIEPDTAIAGLDSWGRSGDETRWRQTAVAGEGGAIYKAAPAEDSSFFDRIINSLCEVPYQQH